MRIGSGYDVHRFSEGRRLIIGGVEIPNDRGLLGHSDADVLIHSICDALLGAAALGDIGRHFPDSDERFSGIDSRILLRKCAELIEKNGYRVVNIDATIVAQRPKMQDYIEIMRANIANDCKIPIEFVNVKATTEEGLGFTGELLGISSQAVCLIE